MKLSIIIPMYGVEKYIEKCLTSCINQGNAKLGTDYEIICVNDGTKDKSAEIARQIAFQHEGISVIDQENQGLSVARNTGTAAAKGEYIWFVDSDDYIEDKCLMRILPLLKDDLDILQLKWRLVFEDGRTSQEIGIESPEGIFTGKEITEKGGLPAPAPFSVLRAFFVKENDFSFYPNIYHEDSEFKPRVSYLAKKIAFDQGISYNYLQRAGGSIMSTFRSKKMYDLMIIVDNLFEFMHKSVANEDRRMWARYFSGPLSELLYLANYSKDQKLMADAKKFVSERPESVFAMSCSPNISLRMVGYLAKLFRGNLFGVFKMLYKVRYRN